METARHVGIKELIKKYPNIADILDEFHIDCPNCKGNCALNHIVEAENLSMDEEMELMDRISRVIPG